MITMGGKYCYSCFFIQLYSSEVTWTLLQIEVEGNSIKPLPKWEKNLPAHEAATLIF